MFQLDPGVDIAVFVVACLFSFVCFVCSVIVVLVIAKRPRLHSFDYIALASIAIVDFFSCLSIVYDDIVEFNSHNYPFKLLTCRFIFYFPYVFPLIFALCITSIAVVRCWWCGHKGPSVAKSVLTMLLIWLVSALLLFPKLVYVELDMYDDFDFDTVSYLCMESYQLKMAIEIATAVVILGMCTFVITVALSMKYKKGKSKLNEITSEGVVLKELNESLENSDMLQQNKEVEVLSDKGALDGRFDVLLIVLWVIFFLITLTQRVLTPLQIFYINWASTITTWMKALTVIKLVFQAGKLFLYVLIDPLFRKEIKALFKRS